MASFNMILGGRLRDVLYESTDESSEDEEYNNGGNDDSDAESDLIIGANMRRNRDQQDRGLTIDTEEPRDDGMDGGAARSEGPTTPWKNSSAKQRIIDELKDTTSDIHLLVGQYTAGDYSKVNFRQILQNYAGNKQYKMGNFRENMKRLLVHLLKKTGPFKREQVEPWYTSAKNVSPAYSLLFALYMHPKHSETIRSMSAEEIWESHPKFQLYQLDQFKGYNKNMKTLTAKRLALISDEEESFKRDMLKITRRGVTSRGIPFWHTHAAAELLKQHVVEEMDNTRNKAKPLQLWRSRPEYQEFPLRIFRKHIYQERTKQIAAPYWQYRRNKNAREKYELKEKMLREWSEAEINRAVEGLVEDWEKMGIHE